MAPSAARLYLITPPLQDASFAPKLVEACKGGAVAAVLVRLGAGDERSLINLVKALAPSTSSRRSPTAKCWPWTASRKFTAGCPTATS